jgi:hypothetical protein
LSNCPTRHIPSFRYVIHLLPAGKAEPLGPSKQGNAINFAVYSQAATAMSLVLHNPNDGTRQEIQMNKSGEAQSSAELTNRVQGAEGANV